MNFSTLEDASPSAWKEPAFSVYGGAEIIAEEVDSNIRRYRARFCKPRQFCIELDGREL